MFTACLLKRSNPRSVFASGLSAVAIEAGARACERAPELKFLLRRLELHRHPVHAVTASGRRRAIGEHVTEMSAAACAVHFGAHREQAPIGAGAGCALEWLVETRPAGAAVVLGLRAE